MGRPLPIVAADRPPTQSVASARAVAAPAAAPPPSLRALLADRWLPAILAVALGLRLIVRWLAPHGDWLGDEREYYSAAAILADGRGLAFIDESVWVRPPLYIVALAVLFRLFGAVAGPVWVAQVALGLATVALVYLLGRLYHDRPAVARLAATACALYLPFAVYAGLLLSETLFTFLVVLAFAALTLHARGAGLPPLLVAGAALGGAILTRGIALPFLAAIPLWALAVRERGLAPDWRRAAARSAIVIGVALLIVAPWTARNFLTYRRVIPVETTGGYNFWLGALRGQNTGQVDATLRAIPNQGDRQSVAWARGWAVVRADPLGYLRKSATEAGDLWRINLGAYERLMRGYALGKVPPPWLALTLALDDGLYLFTLPLAALGAATLGRREDRRLLLLWLAYNALAGALFFAITRFRLPLMPFLFLLAARGALSVPALARGMWHSGGGVPRHLTLPLIVAAMAVAVVGPTFLPGQYFLGIGRAGLNDRVERGYALLRANQPQAALDEFAVLPDYFYARATGLAAAHHALGQDERALPLLNDDLDPLGATLLRGDIFRAQGRLAEARESLNYRDVRILNPTAEAWVRLNPPPLARLDVGDGLDLGYLRGLNLDERDADGTTYRWTLAHAEFRPTAPAGATVVRLRLRGYRPVGPPRPVQVSINGRPLGTVTPTLAWGVYELPLGSPAPGDGPLIVALDTPTFVLSYADQRQLGVMVDWVEVR